MAFEELLQGVAWVLTRKAMELNLEGDMAVLRVCMEKNATPWKDTPVTFDRIMPRYLLGNVEAQQEE